MTITEQEWNRYIGILRKLSDTVADKVRTYVDRHGLDNTKQLIDYSYALVTEYGEGAAALSAQMYDVVAEIEGRYLAPAEVAPTASYGEVAKSVNGTLKKSNNSNEIAGAVSRWIKMAGSDTTLKNSIRDGAEFAWIPRGDTCPFCLTLASRGWQKASKEILKNGHAEHIHSNCDCQYAVRFNSKSNVAGYDPDQYKKMYYEADGTTPDERINAMRRQQYAQNKDMINAQKRAAYAKRREKTIQEQQRLYALYPNNVQLNALDAPGYIEKFNTITEIPKVNESIYKASKEILEHRNGTDFEDLYLIDAQNGEVIHKLTTSDISNGLIYDNKTKKTIDKAIAEGREVIAVHNHPSGLPPTLDDGASAYNHKYLKGVTVGHNLEVYSYSPTIISVTKEQCNELHEGISKVLQFSVDFDDEIWYNALRKYGMEVIRK